MSQFNSISPDFRDSLRQLADSIAKKTEASKEAPSEAPKPTLTIKVAMDVAEINDCEEVVEEKPVKEGNPIGADNK